MDDSCAHFTHAGLSKVLKEISLPLLDVGRDCRLRVANCNPQPILPLLLHWDVVQGAEIRADAGACSGSDWLHFWGTPPFLHLFLQCCVVLCASPHGSPKKNEKDIGQSPFDPLCPDFLKSIRFPPNVLQRGFCEQSVADELQILSQLPRRTRYIVKHEMLTHAFLQFSTHSKKECFHP